MNILLTGSTGFIGSYLVVDLLDAGHNVLTPIRPNSTFRLQSRCTISYISDLVDLIHFDFSGIDLFVHLAAHSPNVPYDSVQACLRKNVIEPLSVFEQAMKMGVKDFLVVGTCFEYGLSAANYDFIPTSAPLLPTNSYAVSKAAASIAFSHWANSNDLKLNLCRLFQVYGEGELETRLYPSLVKAATSNNDFHMSSGDQIRDFLHVKQVSQRLLKQIESLDSQTASVKTTHIASGIPRSVKDFALEIWKSYSPSSTLSFGSLPLRPGEMPRYVALL